MKVVLSLNELIKVKLTDEGKDIYFHQYDEVNKFIIGHGGEPIQQKMPEIDEDGYTTMQLHSFMKIFGNHMIMGGQEVCCPFEIIYESNIL